jgi:hypothetical protein
MTRASAPAQNVPLDSIEEFSVQTNHFSAGGRNSGLPPTLSAKPAPTIFMALFMITSAIRFWRPTQLTTMPTVFRARCSIGTNSEER